MAIRTKQKRSRRSDIRLIVKSNNLVEARYMMNIWETRVFLVLLSMIRDNDDDTQVYRVWYSDVRKKFALKSNTCYDDLRKGAIGLTKKTVYLDWTTDDDFDRQLTTHLVEGADVLKKGQGHKQGAEQQQYVDLRLGVSIRPHLLEIRRRLMHNNKITSSSLEEIGVSGYTSYDMRNVIHLKPYGTRIFELLKKHEKIGIWTISVDRFKKMLAIESEYKRFSHFYQAVIERSIVDINKYTDIRVENVEKIKHGRGVSMLKFHFRGENNKQIYAQGKDENIDTFEQLKSIVVSDFGVTPSVFSKMLNSEKYTESEIKQAIAVTRRAKFSQQIKRSTAAFFISALKNGFNDEKAAQNNKEYTQRIKEEYQRRTSERVRKLVAEEPEINDQILNDIKARPEPGLRIVLKKKRIAISDLTIEHFRNNRVLRQFFISKIVAARKDYFSDINNWYRQQL